MVKKSHGFRSRARKKLRKERSFRPAITRFLVEFRKGQNVVIDQDPSSQKGMPHPRFKRRVGKIMGSRGKGYIIEILDGNKMKRLISRPEHLKAV